MKKHLFLLLLVAFSSISFRSSAVNFAVPIYFHASNQTATTIFNLVCAVNENYAANGVPVTFFVGGIDYTTTTFNNNLQGGANALNVYFNQSVDAYSFDAIKLQTVSGDVLTHEIGHWLGLMHPEGNNPGTVGCGNSNCSGMGDPDCCPDTQPFANGNWMNQGVTGPAVFTQCQKAKINGCLSSRGYTMNFTGNPLQLSSSRVIPWQVFNTNNGQLTFEWSSNCNGLPDYTDVIVHTFCPPGSNEATITYHVTDHSLITNLSMYWGVTQIVYRHVFGLHSYIREVNVNPDISPDPFSYCSITNYGNQRVANVNQELNESASFNLTETVSISVSNSLNYVNHGYISADIYDISGRVISKASLSEGAGQVDISGLASGSYIFKAIKPVGEPKVIRFNK